MTLTLIPMAMAIVSNDKKCHVAPHFDCLNVRNVVVPLTMLMALSDANISAIGMP